jgi:hypothetical protein
MNTNVVDMTRGIIITSVPLYRRVSDFFNWDCMRLLDIHYSRYKGKHEYLLSIVEKE